MPPLPPPVEDDEGGFFRACDMAGMLGEDDDGGAQNVTGNRRPGRAPRRPAVAAARWDDDQDELASLSGGEDDGGGGQQYVEENADEYDEDGAANGYAYEDEEGSTPRSAMAANGAAGREEEWEEVSVPLFFSASLKDLALNPKLSTKTISEQATEIFERTVRTVDADAASDAPKERTTNHLVGGVFITSFKNDFPCAVSLDIEGVGPTRRSCTPDGLVSAHTFFPKTSAESVRLVLADGTGTTHCAFLTDFPGWNAKNLDEGITNLPDGVNCLVRKDHPIIDIFNESRERLGKSKLGPAQETMEHYYRCTQKEARRCIETVRQSLDHHLQIKNLYDAKFSISRANTSAPVSASEPRHKRWMDAAEIYDDTRNEKAQTLRIAEPFSLYVKVLFRYKPV